MAATSNFAATAEAVVRHGWLGLFIIALVTAAPMSGTEWLTYQSDYVSLTLASGTPKNGDPIHVFGNSDGAGVATALHGKIRAVAANRIDVSADFVSGNSGSPIVDAKYNLLAVASFVKKATPKSSQVQRWGYRVTPGTRWGSVDDVFQMGQVLAMLLLGQADGLVTQRKLRQLDCSPELKAVVAGAIGPRRRRFNNASEMLAALAATT